MNFKGLTSTCNNPYGLMTAHPTSYHTLSRYYILNITIHYVAHIKGPIAY